MAQAPASPPLPERKRPRMEYIPADEAAYALTGTSMKQDWIDCLSIEVDYANVPGDVGG